MSVFSQHIRPVNDELKKSVFREPVAWEAPDGTIRHTQGARRFNEWAWNDSDFKPIYNVPANEGDKHIGVRWRHPGYHWNYTKELGQYYAGRIQKELLYE